MLKRAGEANPIDESAELAADGDLSSLARLLHYAKREAEALGQIGAAILVDAALLALARVHSADVPTSSDAASADESSVHDVPHGRAARAHH